MGGLGWGDHNWVYAYTIQPGDTILEIGASDGDDVIHFSNSVGQNGRAIFIEPNPVFREMLEVIISPYENITMVYKAISSSNRVVGISGHDGESHLSHIPPWRPEYEGIGPHTPVEAITLDSLVSDLGLSVIDLLVMDVEGAEYEIFTGTNETFDKGIIRHIATAAYHRPDDIVNFEKLFREKGFTKFDIDRSGGQFVCLHAAI